MSAQTAHPTRVLVVDDSALYRQAICNILRAESGIEVVGIAKDGDEALARIRELDPDVLTLDVQMPGMDGIEVLREMNRQALRPKAIMVSSFTAEGAQVTTDALLEGAFDFILKPSGSDLTANRRTLRDALDEKIGAFRMWSRSRRGRAERLRATAAAAPAVAPAKPGKAPSAVCRAVLIAASTGGPPALREVLSNLPGDLPVPVFVVQHMPARYTSALAQRLDGISPLTVEEAEDGTHARSGMAVLAPGGKQMLIYSRGGKAYVELTDDPPENGCRPSADYTLRSIVGAFDGDVLAVVLTGMGRDAFAGCEVVKRSGGTVFAQDEETSTVYGMPKAVADGDLANRILPLEGVARAITKHVTGS